jgi:hypothetical protein
MRRLLFICGLLLITVGCSNFRKQWNRSLAAAPEREIAGPWEGTWKSDATSHTGKLRCVLTPLPDGKYEAFFKANYLKIFRFSYRMNMEAKPGGPPFKLEGEADLGKLAGGKYTYQGVVSATNFFCTYHSKDDHGTFQLSRPRTK